MATLTACGGNDPVAATPAAFGTALAVPTNAVAQAVPVLPTYPGKSGEIYPPTPYPPGTVVVTPFPPDGDKEFYFTPVPGTPLPTPLPSDPFQQTIVANGIIQSPGEYVKDVEFVVKATVAKVWPARWTTPDGKRPADPYSIDNAKYTIITLVTFRVDTVLKGQLPDAEVVASFLGGDVDQDYVHAPGYDPSNFKLGGGAVLFLKHTGIEYVQSVVRNFPQVWNPYMYYYIAPNGMAVSGGQETNLQDIINEVRAAQK
ncbi:MAG: hypothetical protein M3Z04_01100 [Chloroflexota bacterium]|nr:hypothetical protein [Chloroflexota bacterium]